MEVPQRRITPAAGRYPPALSGRLPPRLAIDRREVANALDPAAQALLVGLAAAGRCRRHLAAADLAQCPSERPVCFDMQGEDVTMLPAHQRSLFADLGPLG